jgi:2'-5' RNA ligase
MKMIRSFIALDLSPEILGRLDAIIQQMSQRLPDSIVRWTPARNIHLTLKFLGEVAERNLDGLFEIVRRAAEQQPVMQLRVSSLGAFPSLNRPRVLWVGVQAPDELAALQRSIDIETARMGYPGEEREFSPHLTLGRISRNASPEEARQAGSLLGSLQVGDLGICNIAQVHFYRSDLNPGGARYTRLYSAALSNLKR